MTMFDYYEKSEEFIGWALISLIATTSKEKHEELAEATKSWSEVDIKVSINGIDVPSDHFFESMKNNMHYWADKKAASTVESVLEGVRDEVEKVEDALRETERFVKSRLEKELGFEFPED